MTDILEKIGSKLRDKVRRYRTLGRQHVLKKPSSVLLETTNNCNLNCPFCMVGQQNQWMQDHGTVAHDLMSRPMGNMSMEMFETVLRSIRAFGILNVYLHFQGEPMLNKLTPVFAKRLKAEGFKVQMFTNGLVFTDKIIEEMVGSGIDLIRFSVDGASEETYRKNRVGGIFAKVRENMEKVVRAAAGTRTRVEWQFLPMRNNEHEVEKAAKMAQEIGINFFAKGFRVTDKERAPKNKKYHSTMLKKPCLDIFYQLGIYWNGDIVPCCYDNNAEEVMGNLNKNSLQEIWDSPKYRTFRRKVEEFATHPEAEPDICKSCLRWSASGDAPTHEELAEPVL